MHDCLHVNFKMKDRKEPYFSVLTPEKKRKGKKKKTLCKLVKSCRDMYGGSVRIDLLNFTAHREYQIVFSSKKTGLCLNITKLFERWTIYVVDKAFVSRKKLWTHTYKENDILYVICIIKIVECTTELRITCNYIQYLLCNKNSGM